MRIRDIIHNSGRLLRVGLDRGGPEGTTIQLSDPSLGTGSTIVLDLYGTELLAGFLMNARLAAMNEGLADERCGGPLGCRLRLTRRNGRPVIELVAADRILHLEQPLWDRLYAELALALAHGRHPAATPLPLACGPASRPRLLH